MDQGSEFIGSAFAPGPQALQKTLLLRTTRMRCQRLWGVAVKQTKQKTNTT